MRDVALAALAHAVLGDPLDATPSDTSLGPYRLHPHQHDAVRRLRPILRQHGGALLADDVGLGKTFVALAIARAYERVEVIAPAGLQRMWRDSAARCRLQPPPVCLSMHRFSHGTITVPPAAMRTAQARRLVIIDEAHHLRNPRTKRYAHVAEYCRAAHLLLLTATPVHNHAADLTHLLALFLGTRAASLVAVEQLALIVRRDASVLESAEQQEVRPIVRSHPAVRLRVGDELEDSMRNIARALAELPAPVPTRDGAAAGALIALGLLRSWCSSAAACLAAVRRRRARAAALADVLAEGKWPSTQELRTWTISEDTVQLGFTSLLVGVEAPLNRQRANEPEPDDKSAFAQRIAKAALQLDTHRQALATIERLVRRVEASLDRARAECVRRVRSRHPGAAVIVFSQFADSVHAMGGVLRWDVGVATLTARGGRVAGGPLTRTELLQRFAPRAHGVSPPARHERIQLLLTTDLLAEGVNLQDAAIVIHLDLPWTPAAIAQREGRIARLGSTHRVVHAYSIAPPGDGETLLRIADRLRRKARAVSVVLAPDAAPKRATRVVALSGTSSPTQDTLLRWRRGESGSANTHCADPPLEWALPHSRAGWLAAVDGELVGGWFTGDRIRTSASREPRVLAAIVRALDESPSARALRRPFATHAHQGSSSFVRAVHTALRREARRRQGMAMVDALQSPLVRAQRQIRRMYSAMSLTDRVRLAPLAAAAARTVASLRGAGDERALEALLDAGAQALSPADWLRALVSLAPASTDIETRVPSERLAPAGSQGGTLWQTLLLLLP